jgi:hypothetical protein
LDANEIKSREGFLLNQYLGGDFPAFKSPIIESLEIYGNKFYHTANVLAGGIGTNMKKDKFVISENEFHYSSILFNDDIGSNNYPYDIKTFGVDFKAELEEEIVTMEKLKTITEINIYISIKQSGSKINHIQPRYESIISTFISAFVA